MLWGLKSEMYITRVAKTPPVMALRKPIPSEVTDSIQVKLAGTTIQILHKSLHVYGQLCNNATKNLYLVAPNKNPESCKNLLSITVLCL